ncbi:hypothetical protein Mal4_37640 [Maioricimonas rarisocia]|uniref:Uncharacterized protein n=1 Tax=Maioricimonas rarisocia TaxID=2528026 RepID=A0A517ZAG8_9PLAN|nr:hypothetical protein [Maioricimonas rarisocia]QDU39419.1 hypothetical protein Mal4_37640 [Maioricimonas rarisocia]
MHTSSIQPEERIRVMQIITLAMVAGVVMFGVVAVLIVGALDEPSESQFISLFAVGVTGLMFGLHLFVPEIVARQAAASAGSLDWYQVYQVRTIVGLALLEGAAFFNIVACILEHNWWSLAVAGGLVFWMLARFPTRSGVEQWIETQKVAQDAQR